MKSPIFESIFARRTLKPLSLSIIIIMTIIAATMSAYIPARRVSKLNPIEVIRTLLLEAGEHPKVVQELLGHSNISTTLDLYSHVVPSMKARVATTINGFLVENQKLKKKKINVNLKHRINSGVFSFHIHLISYIVKFGCIRYFLLKFANR